MLPVIGSYGVNLPHTTWGKHNAPHPQIPTRLSSKLVCIPYLRRQLVVFSIHHCEVVVGDCTFFGHKPLAIPISSIWTTLSERFGWRMWHHLTQLHHGKQPTHGVGRLCVLSTTLIRSWANDIGWPMLAIFSTNPTISSSLIGANTLFFPHFLPMVVPKRWFFNVLMGIQNSFDVINTLELTSITLKAPLSCSSFQSPFFESSSLQISPTSFLG